MKTARSTIFNLFVILTLSLTPSIMLANDEKPVLAGAWELNEALSDDPNKAFKKTEGRSRSGRGEGGRSGGGRRGGGSGKGGSRGSSMNNDSESDGSGQKSAPKKGLMTAKMLDISLTETEMLLKTDTGVIESYLIDGRGTPLDKELTVVLAGWEENQMVVEKTSGGGQKIFERYTVSPTGSQLHVAISIQRPTSSERIKITRVFNRIEVSK